jgi:uncharacterized protein YegP (UPF0339 family)
MKFQIKNSTNGEYYFRIVASNGETLAHSETYTAKASAKNAVESIKGSAGIAQVEDLT